LNGAYPAGSAGSVKNGAVGWISVNDVSKTSIRALWKSAASRNEPNAVVTSVRPL
jgi:hypothetical protein